MKKIYFTFVSILCACIAHSSDIDHLITHARIKHARTQTLLEASSIHKIISEQLLTHTKSSAFSKYKKEVEDVIQKQRSGLAILQTKQAQLESQLQDAQDDAQCPTCGARTIACISVTAVWGFFLTLTQSLYGAASCIAAAALTVPSATSIAGMVVYYDLTEKARNELAEHTVQTKALEEALKQYTLEQGLETEQ